MEINANVNTFFKGLNLDQDVSLVQPDSIRYAENIRLTANTNGTSAILQNTSYIQKSQLKGDILGKVIATCEAKYTSSKNVAPTDCGVIITDNNGMNYIYVVNFDTMTVKRILWGRLGWTEENNLSVVSNYEQYNNNNIYIADGVNPLRKINITEVIDTEVTDITRFDMLPKANLGVFTCTGLTSGTLKSGTYQYAYQLFQKNGSATAVSSLCTMIPIVNTFCASNSTAVKGQQPDEITGKGIELKTTFLNNHYDYIRIYRISYHITGSTPTIEIINEQNIDADAAEHEYIYIDYGSDAISILTVDEFNQLITANDFVPQTIESQQNILFAANIQEDTWDVEYDARAYRANYSGQVILGSSKGEDDYVRFNINSIPKTIRDDHDCYNLSNLYLFESASFSWVYDRNRKLGGTGLNVSYEFIFKEVVLSDKETTSKYVKSLTLNTSSVSARTVPVVDMWGNTVEMVKANQHIPNYADAWMCSNYTGYMRDEIYRFGIVLYNSKRMASPVHWIGDIRMPCAKTAGNKYLQPFHVATTSNVLNKSVELIGYAMGIRFTVNNLPDEVVGYEIVRQPRDMSNRTIITQAIAGALITSKTGFNEDLPSIGGLFDGFENFFEEYNWLQNDMPMGEKGLYAWPWFHYHSATQVHDDINNDDDYLRYQSSEYYAEIVSPEICVSPEQTEPLIENSMLCQLYYYKIPIGWGEALIDDYSPDNDGVHLLSVDPNYIKKANGDIIERDEVPLCALNTEEMNIDNGRIPFMCICINDQNDSQGSSSLFKYYNTELVSGYDAVTVENCTFPGVYWGVMQMDETVQFQTPIADKSYLNISVRGPQQWGWHGINLVVKTDKHLPFIYMDYQRENKPFTPDATIFNAVPVLNIKRTCSMISDTHSSRNNSTYVSCGGYANRDQRSVNCFGGDTYLVVLDYLNTSFPQLKNDTDADNGRKIHTQCYIPFESTVNTNLFVNDQYHQDIIGEIHSGPNLIQHDISTLGAHVQSMPQYVYNTIYSQQDTSISFVHKLMWAEDDLLTSNRIANSDLKTNNEIQDSWLAFRAANYLDVDNKYGSVTNLKSFNNKLYFFQENAVGIAAVNERSLISDNIGELTLGTGGVLSGYDYLTTTNGNSISNDRSIINSTATLYWYDYNKNSICMIGQGVDEVSKVKLVQSYLNGLWDKGVDRSHPVSTFDKKYDEVWIKVYDKSLVLNERLGVFTSFYTHDYDHSLTLGDRFITVKNNVEGKSNVFYKHNEQVDMSTEVEPLTAELKIIVADNYPYTKVFDNVLFAADFTDNVDNISKFVFKTKNQTSFEGSAEDIECREDTYRFAIPREECEMNEMSYAGRMRGKYLEEFYTFDCNDNKQFTIPYIKTTYRQSRL